MTPERSPQDARLSLANAYSGEVGRRRAEFCVDFTRRKQDSFRRIQSDIFAQVAARGETVTCHKGCSVCCVLYVEANIQECEAISYYLHQNSRILSAFFDRYDAWRQRMRRLGDPFRLCEEILHRKRWDAISQTEQASLLDALLLYQEQNIPCSFLDEGACSIYEVRPYACVNHYVTTPSDWCRAENWCNPSFPHRPRIYMTTIDEINERSFYRGELARPIIGFLPTTVYRILTEGLEYVAGLTGIHSVTPE